MSRLGIYVKVPIEGVEETRDIVSEEDGGHSAIGGNKLDRAGSNTCPNSEKGTGGCGRYGRWWREAKRRRKQAQMRGAPMN